MKEQNYELRSLYAIALDEDECMSEILEVLSKSPLYSSSIAVDQYKDLMYAINFTKIADMLHLITHYGAVSAEQIKNFEKSIEVMCTKHLANNDNQKKRADLLMKKLYTEKYLKQYSLRQIDCSLDKMFPRPIGLHDEHQWYTVAARMLLDEFQRINLQINEHSCQLYFTDDYGKRQCIDDFSVASFAEFLEIMLHTSNVFNYQLDWSEKDLKKFLENLQEDERFVTYE